MPRPRYPSDETRLKRPSGVMVGFSVRNPDPEKPGHAEVFEDPVKRGIWLGLLLVAGQAFAGRTDDRVTLSRGDLIWVTGQPRYDRAVATLRTVCGHMGYEVVQRETAVRQQRGASVTVHVKNLSQNQGWTPQAPRSSTRTPSASDSESDSDSDSDTPPTPSRGKRVPPEDPDPIPSEPDPPLKDPEPEAAPPAKGRDYRAEVRAAWPECQSAASSYGASWRALNKDRLTAMAARLRENPRDGPEVLVQAIHGAMAYWRATCPDKDHASLLKADTVYRPGNFVKYLEQNGTRSTTHGTTPASGRYPSHGVRAAAQRMLERRGIRAPMD